MSRTEVNLQIDAPVEAVFDAVAHIQNFQAIVPDIVKVEFLTEQHTGVGTRFRETRMMGKRQAATELEVTEYEPHAHVRMVADAGGTIWDTTFTTKSNANGGTDLSLVMDARAYRLASKLFNPLIKGMVRKHIVKDMDAVKAHCES